mgnify:CR=1 FL=1
MLQMQGVKGKAVVSYAAPLTTLLARSRVNGEMQYARLSHRVRNMDFPWSLDVTDSETDNIAQRVLKQRSALLLYSFWHVSYATLG